MVNKISLTSNNAGTSDQALSPLELERRMKDTELQFTGLSTATLRRHRLLGTGPRWQKIGGAVRYRLGDVLAWLESRPSGGGHQAEAK